MSFDDNDKIEILTRVENACKLFVLFSIGVAFGAFAGYHLATDKHDENVPITASAEELPNLIFNYNLNVLAYSGTSAQNVIVPFSYVYDPLFSSIPSNNMPFGSWEFVSATSPSTGLANYPHTIFNYPITPSQWLPSYTYSLGSEPLYTSSASYPMSSGVSLLTSSRVTMRVFTDFTDFGSIDTRTMPAITIVNTRALEFETLFPNVQNVDPANVVYQMVNVSMRSNTDKSLNMLMVFPMLMRPSVTSLDSVIWQYSAGQDTSYSTAFNKGITYADSRVDINSASYKSGYETGIIAGQASANDYSFFSLIYAVVDAPISVLQEMLNFEFLGVNLSSLVFGILSLVIVAFVVKILLFK